MFYVLHHLFESQPLLNKEIHLLIESTLLSLSKVIYGKCINASNGVFQVRLPMKLLGSEYFGNLTNQNFDSLLSTFLANVKDGSDFCGKSEINLLNLEVELSKSYSIALRHLNYLMNDKKVHLHEKRLFV